MPVTVLLSLQWVAEAKKQHKAYQKGIINMNKLRIFGNSEFGEMRTIEDNGKVLFCGSDVAKALGYAVPKDAITAHCKGAVKHRLLTNGGEQDVKFISEGDVYRLITHSKLPTAEKFEKWVFDDVLPTFAQQAAMFPMMICLFKHISLLRTIPQRQCSGRPLKRCARRTK